jgi:hypothetical protein
VTTTRDVLEKEREITLRHIERARGENAILENQVLSLRTNVSVEYMEPSALEELYDNSGFTNPMYNTATC